MTIVFQEDRDNQVARLQPEVLRKQPVLPLLPAYSKWVWVKLTELPISGRHPNGRIFFQFFDYAIDNAYLQYDMP